MRFLLVGFSLLMLLSCSSPRLVKDFEEQEVPESIKTLDDYEPEETEEVVEKKSASRKLSYAYDVMKLGDYDTAIATYLKIYENKDYKSEHREEALFKLGNLYESVHFEGRDYKKAIYYYDLLLKEFIISTYRLKAYNKIEELHFKLEEEKENK